MTRSVPKLQDVGARLLCVWGVAWGCYGLTIPEPFARVFGFLLALICGAAVFMPRVMAWLVICFGGLLSVLSMLVGLGAAGLGGFAFTAFASLVILGPPVVGAIMLNQLHNPGPPKPGICSNCGYSLASLRSDRCPECGTEMRGGPGSPMKNAADFPRR